MGLSAADASGLQAAATRQQIDIAILKQVQDSFEQQGQAAIKLLESAVEVAEQAGTITPDSVDVNA